MRIYIVYNSKYEDQLLYIIRDRLSSLGIILDACGQAMKETKIDKMGLSSRKRK